MRRLTLCLLVPALAFAPEAGAQRVRAGDPADYSREWLADCRERDDHDGGEVFCAVREYGWRASDRGVAADAGRNGGVRAFGWDRDSVHLVALVRARARSEAAARELAEEVRIETGGEVRVDAPDGGRRESVSVSLVFWVPRRTDLDFEAHNGPVSIEDVAGRIRLASVNGPVTLRGLGGDVRAETSNGPLHIELTGARWEGTGLDAETSNGPVTLDIPAGYNARLETGAVNGPVSIDFPVTVQGRISWRRFSTDLGSGGPTIRAVTTNGPVRVRRR